MKKAILLLSILSLVFAMTCFSRAEQAGESCEVYLQYTVFNTEQTGIQDVEEAINEISIPAIGVKVHITPVFIGDLPSETAYAIAGGEKIDIVNVGLTHDIMTMVSDGYLLPLDELLLERGPAVLKATEKVSDAQKIGGVTYAISQYPYAARCTGFLFNKKIAEENGIEMHNGMTLQELENAGKVLKNKDVYLTSLGLSAELSYQFFCPFEAFGEAANYGAILDPADNSRITNIYDSEELREYYRTIRRWFEAGYLPENQMLNEVSIIRLFNERRLFGIPTNVTADQLGGASPDRDIVLLSDPMVTNSSVHEFMLGIASTCQNPEAAMDFINLIYENADLANLLNYGIEGVDYVKVPGASHVITTAGTANEDGSRYGSGFSRFGDPMMVYVKEPLTDDYYEELAAWETNARTSLSFGYSFDAEAFSVEARNIARILDEYLPILNVGMAQDVDAEMDALVAALQEAGIDEIIAANNEQLQEYLQTKKVP
ncbi:MAG: ABC transporter substrate-binding protein [Parasporobacterium sp.]|nr:ABC transporter substrate-binding protein [Parasporobacterium sp.]